MRSAAFEPASVKASEVPRVFADDGTSLGDSGLKHLRIAQRLLPRSLVQGDHVMTLAAKDLSDSATLLLIEQQFQRRAAFACRFAAASACSNSSSFARIQSSISDWLSA